VTNVSAGFSGKPDVTFVSFAAIEEGRVVLVTGRSNGFIEIEGSPDMLLEVVSDSSEIEDCNILLDAYYQAGVQEYWLIDPRQPAMVRYLSAWSEGVRACTQARRMAQIRRFGKSFRLTRTTDQTGHPEYSLEVK
jgi:Uma2 family endonuclease